MDAKTAIGSHARRLCERKGLTQDQIANKTGISYQFLSGLENGRENFSINVLESLATALDCSVAQLVTDAFASQEAAPPLVNASYFRRQVPLPPGLRVEHLETAMNATQILIARINANLIASGAKPLPQYIQGNNFSGLVSNVFCDALTDHSPYKHNSDQAYPDLINPSVRDGGKAAGLEVKSTIQIGKGGESHNGHSGWHLIACFTIAPDTGVVRFVHIMAAILNGHTQSDSDWTYVGSKVNATTGSRRTETYNTMLAGTTKLRDGSVYLDPTAIDFKRWRQSHAGRVPTYSIFSPT